MLFITLNKENISDEVIFGALGKAATLKTFLTKHGMQQYTVAILFSHHQFRQLEAKLRSALNEEINIMVI